MGLLTATDLNSTLYNGVMARGWDSKSVEAQIEDNKSASMSRVDGQAPSPDEIQRKIKKNTLLLSRKRILQEIESSSNPRYSELLRRSLADLDVQLQSNS